MFKKFWDKLTGKTSSIEAGSAESPAGGPTMDQLSQFKGSRKELFKMLRDPKVRQQIAELYQRMKADGVDIKNEQEAIKWMTAHKDELSKAAPTQAQVPKSAPIVRQGPKIGRNDPCPCNSGKKYKKCCALKEPAST